MGPKSAGWLLPGVGILSQGTEGRNFLFCGINLLSASSQAVPVPCWALLLFWKLVLPGSASLGEGLGRSVHLSPGSHSKLSVLDGSLYLELLLKSRNSSFPECRGWGKLYGRLFEWDGGACGGSLGLCRTSRHLPPAALALRRPWGCQEPLPVASGPRRAQAVPRTRRPMLFLSEPPWE